ncbi:MAG: carboxynorspermidine decarboxylase [Bacteroidetes bacterium]|nr:carboxynorspermidine decarboxylase [Bacteroidota bacterium]
MAIDFSKIPSPCYVLEEQRLRNNLELIRDVKERSGAKIILAFKGFAMWGAFPILNEYGFTEATASSLAEARLAVEEMGSPAHTYAPVYTNDDIDDIIKLSSHITFNSLTQYNRFLPAIKAIDKKVSLGLRVNPEYSEVTTDLYNPCATGSRLGILASQLSDNLPAEIEGLHFHALCESNPEELQKVLFSFEERFAKYLPSLKWVNFGGGHLMTRKGYNIELLISIIRSFKSRYPNLEVILEPGSAFAWDTGYLVSTIEDIVENNSIKTAILNVSFTAHMPDCLEMPYKPVILGAIEETEGVPTYRMGGNSCLAGDYMGNWSFMKPLEVGDRIIFNDMIHYTMVKTCTFNGVKHPSIGIWNEHDGFKLLREFGYEDYKNRLS